MSITEQKVFWKRIGYVAIQGRDGKMYNYGGSKDSLDFKFSGEKFGELYCDFSVSILGLTMDTINDLTVWDPAEAYNNKRKIQVYAGYEKDGIPNLLFDGYILEAMPTNPPEMWMNFKCIINFDKNTPVEKPEVAKGTIDTIFKKILKVLDMNGKIIAENLDKKNEFIFNICGNKGDLLNAFVNAFGLSMWGYDNLVIINDKDPWKKKASGATEVSTASGMLGLGNISLTGALIRRRLDDTAKIGSWVNMKSSIVPRANGNYFVISKKHVGHFRGDDWYTELDCVREQKGK